MILQAVGLCASIAIVVTYWLHVVRDQPIWWFHAANAYGGGPLILVELATGAWLVVPVTATFMVVGWMGLWRWASEV